MSTLSSDLTARVAKLLPRLATDQQGEVANVAAAISRTLKAAGHDLHDLAAHIAEGPREVVIFRDRPGRQGPAPYPFGTWRHASHPPRTGGIYRTRVNRCQNASAGRLNEWEDAFLLSVAQQLERGRGLSPKQVGILNTIAAKLGVST